MVATRAGWEETNTTTGGGGGCGSLYHPVPRQESPRGEKVASCPRQSRLSLSSGAQVITRSSLSLLLGEKGLSTPPSPQGPSLPLLPPSPPGNGAGVSVEVGSQPSWEKIKSPLGAQQLTVLSPSS